MSLRLGSLKIPWLGKESHANDPYWEFFINAPPADLANTVIEMVRNAPEGNIFPTKAELHTPQITSSHVKELARYLGTDLVGIAKLDSKDLVEGYPFGVVCAVAETAAAGKLREASADRYRCRTDCLLPSFSARGLGSLAFAPRRRRTLMANAWRQRRVWGNSMTTAVWLLRNMVPASMWRP